MRAAALPAGALEHRGNGAFEALVAVADNQLHASQATCHQPESGRPGECVRPAHTLSRPTRGPGRGPEGCRHGEPMPTSDRADVAQGRDRVLPSVT